MEKYFLSIISNLKVGGISVKYRDYAGKSEDKATVNARGNRRISMKKILSIVVFIAITSIFSFAEKQKIEIVVDAKNYTFHDYCELYRNTTYATTDFYKKAFGVNVKIDGNKIQITKDDIKIDATINSGIYVKNEEKIFTKEVAYKKKNKIFLPLRVFSYLLNHEIGYEDTETYKCKITITESNKMGLEKQIQTIPKNEKFEISDDGKWAVWAEQAYHQEGNNMLQLYVVYLKNMQTEEIKEIYSSESSIASYLIWTKDNELIMGSYEDREGKKDRPHFVIYNPTTNKARHLKDKKYVEENFAYSESRNALTYEDIEAPSGQEYKIIYLDTKKVENISKELHDQIWEEYREREEKRELNKSIMIAK